MIWLWLTLAMMLSMISRLLDGTDIPVIDGVATLFFLFMLMRWRYLRRRDGAL